MQNTLDESFLQFIRSLDARQFSMIIFKLFSENDSKLNFLGNFIFIRFKFALFKVLRASTHTKKKKSDSVRNFKSAILFVLNKKKLLYKFEF